MEYNQAKSNYEQAYQAADPDTKAWVDGFMESVARYQIKDPINDRSTRDHLTLAYQIGSEMIAQGRDGYVTPSASPRASTKNMFNGYSHEENVNNANEIARRYVRKNAPKQTTGTVGSTPVNNVLHWTYNWNESWDPGWALENESLTSKMNKFAAMLAGNLDSLIQHKNAGHVLHGISPDKVNSYISVASDLNAFRQRLSSGAYDEDTQSGLMALADISSKVGVDPSAFKEYFGLNPNSDGGKHQTAIDRINAQLNDNGFLQYTAEELGLNPEIAQVLRDKEANLWLGPDGKTYVLDAWGNPVSIRYINTDPRLRGQEGSNYNIGALTDERGKLWTGDVTKLTSDSPYYNIFTEARNKIVEDNKGKYTLFPWYRNHAAFIDTEDPLLSAINGQYNFGDATFADVSDLYEGPQRIVAVNPKGQDFADEYGRFNPINTGVLDNDTQFFYIDNNGQLIKASAADLAPLYNPFGYNERNDFALPNYYRFAESGALRTLQMPSDWKPENSSVTIGGKKVSLKPNQKITENNETITAWATLMLNILSKEEALDAGDLRLLEHFVGEGASTDNILMIIQEFADEGKINFTPLCAKLWKKVLKKRQEEAAIVSNKEGGVLYAANGQVVDIYGNEMSTSKPKKKSSITTTKTVDEQLAEYRALKNDPTYLATQQSEALKNKYGENEWSTADKVRLGSAVADLTSLVAAMFPGAGTVASVGLGVGSSLTNFGADIADDGFQLSDLGNLGKNLLFDFVGAVPGVGSAGKISKVGKMLLTWGPKLYAAWDGMKNGPRYAAAFKKFTTDPKNMSKDDWMDLIQGLKLITSGTKVVSNKVRYGNIKKAAKAKGVGKAYEVEVRKGTSKDRITLREKEVAKIMDQPNLEAANAELKRIAGKEYSLIPETSGALMWKKLTTNNPLNLDKLEGQWWKNFITEPPVKAIDFHPEDAYRALQGTKWATPRMRMFGWNASELERATGRAGKYGLKSQDSQFTTFRDLDTPTPEPKRSRTERTNKKSNKSTTPTDSYAADTSTYDKQGGKLDRFGEYLKSRK